MKSERVTKRNYQNNNKVHYPINSYHYNRLYNDVEDIDNYRNRIENTRSTPPKNPYKGMTYLDDGTNTITKRKGYKRYNGDQWEDFDMVLWDDLRFPFTRDKQGQNALPDFDFTELGLLFPQNKPSEIVYLIAQFPHSMKLNSDISPHVHFIQSGQTGPTFKMDYRWYDIGDTVSSTFTTIATNSLVFEYTSGDLMQIATFPDIDGSNVDTISSFMDIKIYRDDNDVEGDILVKEFDIHYQIDTNGSQTEYEKYGL